MTLAINEGKGDLKFDAILPINKSREEFYEETLEELASGDEVPDNLLLEYAVETDLYAVYLPYVRFRGNYQGDFTCEAGSEVVHYVPVVRNNNVFQERRVDINWEPFQRQINGKFAVDVCYSNHLDDRFLQYLQTITSQQELKKISVEYVRGHSVERAVSTPEPDDLFRKRGVPTLQLVVEENAESQAPERRRNLKVGFNYQIEQSTPFIAAAWIQRYCYNGEQYTVVMDGSSGELIAEKPIDHTRVKWVRDIWMLGHISWVPALISVFTAGFWWGLATLLLSYGAASIITERIKLNSRRLRQKILSVVRSGGGASEMSGDLAKAAASHAQMKLFSRLQPLTYAPAIVSAVLFLLLRAGGTPALDTPTSATTGTADVAINTTTAETAAAVVDVYVRRSVNVRSQPTSSSTTAGRLVRGTRLRGSWVIGNEDQWLLISEPSNVSGNYVWGLNLAPTPPPPFTEYSETEMTVLTGGKIYQEPDFMARVIDTASPGLKVLVVAGSDEGWYEIGLKTGGVGYIRRDMVEPSGPEAAEESASLDDFQAPPSPARPQATSPVETWEGSRRGSRATSRDSVPAPTGRASPPGPSGGRPNPGRPDAQTARPSGTPIASLYGAQGVVSPQWLRKPDASDLERYYPSRAREQGVSGRATIECTVTTNGSLTDCAVESESPAGMGFGEATIRASSKFRMRPRTVDGAPVEGARVRIPLNWNLG